MRFVLLLAAFVVSPAFAQPQQALDPEQMQAQWLIETGQLRQALGQAQAQIIQLRKENAELKQKLESKPDLK